MEKELVELFEAAKKAADTAAVEGASSGGPKVDRCVDVLNQLRSFPVSYDVLVSTQVAKRLRPLTKHPAEQIKARVSDVLENWKKIIINEATRKKNDGIDIRSSKKTEVIEARTVKVEEFHRTGSFKAEKVPKTEGGLMTPRGKSETIKFEKKVGPVDTVMAEKMNWSETIKVEKIAKEEKHVVSRSETIKIEKKVGTVDTVKAEKNGLKEEKLASSTKKPSQASNAPPKLTSMIKCHDALRDKMRELLLEALSKVSGEVDDDMKDVVDASDPIRVAVAVESVMFEKLGRSNGAQKVKYRSIMFNLKDPKNPDLRRRVLIGQIKPERLINLTPEEMASDERQRENKQIKDKALFECERAGAPKASTDQFKCGRCGQRKCTYYQLQTRSADEPMTTFVTCVNCNNHWKFC